jgi:hypothetical protein
MKPSILAASLVLLTVCGAAFAQQTAAPAALLSAVSATQSAKAPYAFDFDFQSTSATLRAHFDPKATPHVTMVAPAQDHLSNDQRRVFDALQQQLDGLSWCAGERMGHIANMRLLREDADSATYSFQPTRESMRGQVAQYADRLRGELTILKANPDISALHIFTPTAFDPIPFVHIANVDVAITCVAAPNGRRYAARTVSQTIGSALGQTINEHNVQRVSNLSAAP